MKIILASGSPRRRELLGDAGIPFEVKAPEVDESRHPREKPLAYVRRVAQLKHRCVAEVFPRRTVLAADTIVVLGSSVLGKPRSRAEATQMLRRLSGRTHVVLTAVVAGNRAYRRTQVVRTSVTFRRLSTREIARYVGTGEPLDKAGAYGAQGQGRVLVARLRGSYTNVIGLPMAETLSLLHTATRS